LLASSFNFLKYTSGDCIIMAICKPGLEMAISDSFTLYHGGITFGWNYDKLLVKQNWALVGE